jgi:hypothetical protein
VVWLEREKMGEEPLIVIKFLYYVADFSLSLIKPPCFAEISRTCLIYVETWWAIG